MATAQKGGFRGGYQTGDDGNRDSSMAGVPPIGAVGEVGWTVQAVGELAREQ